MERASVEEPERRRPGFVERRLVLPLLEVANQLDPRLPAIGQLALAMVHEMVVTSIRGAFRWIWLSGSVAVLGLLAAAATSGWQRAVILVLIVVPATAGTGLALAVRWSMLRTAHGIAGAHARPEHRKAIRSALRRSRLPTSAFGLVRMLGRITLRGPRREVTRIHEAARELATDLGLQGSTSASEHPIDRGDEPPQPTDPTWEGP